VLLDDGGGLVEGDGGERRGSGLVEATEGTAPRWSGGRRRKEQRRGGLVEAGGGEGRGGGLVEALVAAQSEMGEDDVDKV
jgi:hypothetical protein